MIWLICTTLWAQEPHAEAALLTEQPGLTQGLTQVEVTLWRPLGEPDAPRPAAPLFPEPRVSDAIAVLSTSAPPPEERVVEGVSWLVQKRRYRIFPLAAGSQQFPALEIRWEQDQDWTQALTEPLALATVDPPGLTPGLEYVVAEAVSLESTVEGELASLRVGDAFTITWTVTATGTDALMLPDLAVPTPRGLRTYTADPALRTRTNRGRQQATRTQAVTYVAEQLGTYRLPAASLWWFQPSSGAWYQATAEPVTFRARLNPTLGTEAAGTVRSTLAWMTRWVFLLLGAWLALRGVAHWLRKHRGRRPPRTADAETVAFRALRAQAKRNDAKGTLSATYRWLGVRGIHTLEAWQASYPAVAPETERMLAAALEGSAWAGQAFARAAAGTRRPQPEPVASPLPALNP